MSDEIKIQLDLSRILKLQLEKYPKDFTFIINGEEFKTSRILSDLLSEKINQFHYKDPTIDHITINTQHRGNFSEIFKLLNFRELPISNDDLPFLAEIIDQLENESITISAIQEEEITNENIFKLISKHYESRILYEDNLRKDIEFITSHFYEMIEENKEEMSNLDIDILYEIIENEHLRLNTEDELLRFINELYKKDRKYNLLYEGVIFEHASVESIKEFHDIYYFTDMTHDTWERISSRLCHEITNQNQINENDETNRYTKLPRPNKDETKKGKLFTFTSNERFEGILQHLLTKSSGKILNEINITGSSVTSADHPQDVVIYEDLTKRFYSKSLPNSWICFDFKEHRVIPTDYTIRSENYGPGNNHPKNWVIECSTDQNTWDIVDEISNCSYLNDKSVVHTFKIHKQTNKPYQFLRMRQTDKNWNNNNFLVIGSFEIYGELI